MAFPFQDAVDQGFERLSGLSLSRTSVRRTSRGSLARRPSSRRSMPSSFEIQRVLKAFEAMDVNGDGELDASEIQIACKKLGLNFDEQEVERIMNTLDADGKGKIVKDDFNNFAHRVLTWKKAKEADVETIGQTDLEEKAACQTASYVLLLLVLYIAIGCCYGHYRQGWSVVDSFYFVVATFATVGYGDLSFVGGDARDRIFGGFYVFFGVAFVGTACSILLERFIRMREVRNKAMMEEIRLGEVPQFDLNAELRKLKSQFAYSIGRLVLVLLIGAAGIIVLETDQNWSLADGFYFASVTMTTVGYGDLTPKSRYGRIFTSVYILVSFSIIASAMTRLARLPFEARRLRDIHSILNQFGDCLDFAELEALCAAGEIQLLRGKLEVEASLHPDFRPHVKRAEFVIWQLLKQRKVDFDTDVAPCLNIFEKLDKDGSGCIDGDDIIRFFHERLGTNVYQDDSDEFRSRKSHRSSSRVEPFDSSRQSLSVHTSRENLHQQALDDVDSLNLFIRKWNHVLAVSLPRPRAAYSGEEALEPLIGKETVEDSDTSMMIAEGSVLVSKRSTSKGSVMEMATSRRRTLDEAGDGQPLLGFSPSAVAAYCLIHSDPEQFGSVASSVSVPE